MRTGRGPRGRLKRAAIIVLVVLGVIVAVMAVYGFRQVRSAEAYTHSVIVNDLRAARWRRPNGAPIPFQITHRDLSPRQIEILVAVQDPGFYRHAGIDLSTPGAGLTTITQAIVKQLYFSHFKSGIAKIKQSLIAVFVVDNLIAKEDQLTLFINAMFFGNVDGRPVVGLAAAAEAYYEKAVTELDEGQYISLVAMLVMPGTFHLRDHPQWNRDRCDRIKALIDGRYRPKGLMDQFYGELPQEVIDAGLPAFSYFGEWYAD